ncbi:MAG: hypothetical protein FWE76_03725 [Symbiobacteriaceae bacterium]|nr:hypothetical protein [Symbiobacteriaceae bacterium]
MAGWNFIKRTSTYYDVVAMKGKIKLPASFYEKPYSGGNAKNHGILLHPEQYFAFNLGSIAFDAGVLAMDGTYYLFIGGTLFATDGSMIDSTSGYSWKSVLCGYAAEMLLEVEITTAAVTAKIKNSSGTTTFASISITPRSSTLYILQGGVQASSMITWAFNKKTVGGENYDETHKLFPQGYYFSETSFKEVTIYRAANKTLPLSLHAFSTVNINFDDVTTSPPLSLPSSVTKTVDTSTALTDKVSATATCISCVKP